MVDHKYACIKCNFYTDHKQRYNSHTKSIKHNSMDENQAKYIHICTVCNNKYKSTVGLWKHKQKCNQQLVCIPISEKPADNIDQKLDELRNMIIEIKQQPPSITTHQNININMILNENITTAKNFMDFIDDIKLDTKYRDYITSEDYVSDVVRMLKTEIDKIPVIERPIQCIKNEDQYQNIIHIRHENEWKKETELEWTMQMNNDALDDDAPTEEELKVIFAGIKRLEENIIEQIRKLYESAKSFNIKNHQYKCEIGHVPNKLRIIKSLLEYIHIDKTDLWKMLETVCK